MEKMKRREWLTRVVAAAGLAAVARTTVHSAEGATPTSARALKTVWVVIDVERGTTSPDPVRISVSKSEQVGWVCMTDDFKIESVKLAHAVTCGAHAYPFVAAAPFSGGPQAPARSGEAKR